MASGKRIRPSNEEIPLPEAIIQDVQSRLTRKEAAKTTALSKSWYKAWLARPDIDLDSRDTPRNDGAEDPGRFAELARKTVRRYDELNLKIRSFKICMESDDCGSCSLVTELVEKAVQLGATDIDVEFISEGSKMKFSLPPQVLLSGNLVRLSVKGCQCVFDLGEDGKVNCQRLESLELCNMYARGDVIWDIISGAPVIEKLSLSDCSFLHEEAPFNPAAVLDRNFDLGPFGFGKQKLIGEPIRKPTNLILRCLKIDPSFFHDFSSKFPCLKDLTLSNCLGPKKIQICSQSLECITVHQIIMLRATIDVPNLRVFTCSSGHIPSLTFGTVSRQWESHITAGCSGGLSLAWFRKFKSFLTIMSGSKLSLSLSVWPSWRDSFLYAGNIKPGPILEDLTISYDQLALESAVFWDGLFWSCRPQLITVHCSSGHEVKLKEFVSKRLTKVGENCYVPNKSVFGQSHLEEVNVEVFDVSVSEWEPVTWKALLDAPTVTGTKRKIRFRFKWGW